MPRNYAPLDEGPEEAVRARGPQVVVAHKRTTRFDPPRHCRQGIHISDADKEEHFRATRMWA